MRFILSLIFLVPSLALASNSNEIFKRLIEISSGPFDVNGVTQVQSLISEELKLIKFQTEMIPSDGGKMGPLLVGTLKGQSPRFITFIVHADTVFERSSGFTSLQISEDGKTAKGPGVIDDKGGVVVLLSGLTEYLRKNSLPRYSLRVISSPGEEIGTPEFLHLFKKYSADSILVLGFEP